MKITKTFTPANRDEWRAWLAENYDKEQEIWLVYFKPASGKTGIDYESSIEIALCYGWVDSIIQKIDDEKYARKFNPRREKSFWSKSNKTRMEKLIAEKRMTAIGLAKYNPQAQESPSEEGQMLRQGKIPIPPEFSRNMEANPRAWQNFQQLPPSQQRLYMGWVLSAKKDETRQKRLAEIIFTLEQGKKLGLK